MKPTEGTVIEGSIKADLSELSVKHACDRLVEAGTVPRVLQVSLNEDLDLARDVAIKNGLSWLINAAFSGSEWVVHDLKEGDDRVTYWNPPF